MAQLSLSLSVRHDVGRAAERIGDLPDKLTGAMRDATPEATRVTAELIMGIIQAKAGGVYWDVNTSVRPTPAGAIGSVVTPPSRPHRIEPTKEHGLLVFDIGGKTVFIRGGVNHPGSNPVDWVSSMNSAPTETIGRPFEREVGRVFAGGGSSLPAGGL